MMNLSGMEVTHKTYGPGVIKRIEENKMEVEFSASERIFLYPDSFEKFFVIRDKSANKYISEKLAEKRETRQTRMDQAARKVLAASHAGEKRKNGHGVFDIGERDMEELMLENQIFAGAYLSGKSKGSPRVPQNINANSVCLLTSKSGEEKESGRQIVGMFMAAEDFIGKTCVDGMIQIHPLYRVSWNEDQERLLLWNYLSRQSKNIRWGNIDMKYLPESAVKKILTDMIQLSEGAEHRQVLQSFYEYFCRVNDMI